MDKKGSRWLSISIFISKTNWHLALKNSIRPLIELLFEKGDLYAFKTEFNYQSGENIRVSLLVPDTRKYAISQSIDQSLMLFFKVKKLLPVLPNDQYYGMFMPYPSNTVQYGLYSTITYTDYNYLQLLEQALSSLMLEAFADEEIDDEMILTFVLYVLFNCYSFFSTTDTSLAESWQSYYQHITNHFKAEYNDEPIQEQYNLMEVAIDEIFSDCINGTNQNELVWIKTWENELGRTWAKINGSVNTTTLFGEINLIINEQLNIDANLKFLIAAFVDKTITKHKLSTNIN